MENERPVPAEKSTGWLSMAAWAALLVALLAWQGWLTLALFGGAEGWAVLANDEPIMSGSHPQHLYLGLLGAQGLRSNGTTCVYDPWFQAGYPKTPIFDGMRIAEIVLFLAKELPPARAYKLGVAILCLSAPIFLLAACWGANLNFAAAALASSLGLLIWWGPHGRDALEAGDAEMLIASLAVLCHIGMLLRFDRSPGAVSWVGLVVTAGIAILSQPMLFPIVLPLLLTYYLSAGVRHPLPWHLALFASEALALGANLFWLSDWFSYWWLRAPLPSAADLLPHRTLATFWNAPIWGGHSHRLLALILFASGLVGVIVWNQTGKRAAARLFGLGSCGLLVLALLGISWEPLGQMGTSIFLTPALWFAALPAAYGWVWLITQLGRTILGRIVLAIVVAVIAGVGSLAREELTTIAQRTVTIEPLAIGLGPQREEVIATLRQYTTSDARILWEDRKLPRKAPLWSVLLPWLTDRIFLGGLDPAGAIEHSSISFIDEALEGRHISLWSDKGLDDYCRRYNVSWIVAWSPAVIERLKTWPGSGRQIPVRDDVDGVLFLLKTPGPGYISRGQAQIVSMNNQHIVLADVVPDNGEVILNLHYLAGLRSAPSRVSVEREPCGHDPIGFIRLKMTNPVPRMTLTWDRQR